MKLKRKWGRKVYSKITNTESIITTSDSEDIFDAIIDSYGNCYCLVKNVFWYLTEGQYKLVKNEATVENTDTDYFRIPANKKNFKLEYES